MTYNHKPIVEAIKSRRIKHDELGDYTPTGHDRMAIQGNTRSLQVQVFQEQRKADGTYIRAVRWVNHKEYVS